MARSLTSRLGLQRWSADSDTQQRSDFDNDNAQLESLVAKAAHGAIGARPASSAAMADSFYLITDATGGGVIGTLYYCDGTTWTVFAPRKQGLAVNRPAASLATQTYYKTDSDLLSIDDGAAWHDFPSKAVTDGAYLALTAAQSASITPSQATASTTFTDLTTAGPADTVTIGPSGRALVIVGAGIQNDTIGQYGLMSYAVSGATTRAAADTDAALIRAAAVGQEVGASRVSMATGLTPGSTTFTAKYRATSGNATFINRSIIVIPL